MISHEDQDADKLHAIQFENYYPLDSDDGGQWESARARRRRRFASNRRNR